ncbi:MAG: hypothetical protein AMXMBFR45_10900 [Gammaproteobacteria bacterium]|nr:MAG: hypothetical protein BroJett010_11890 [Gammaproteobacteria bacterium]
MQVFKVGLVMAAGLGSTWAARQVTDAWLGPPGPQYLMQAPAAEPAAPAAAGAAAPAKPPELSREEMEAELRRAQAELDGKPTADELQEFRPSKPLAADLAIALPSDI